MRGKYDQIFAALKRTDPRYFLAAVAIYTTAIMIASLRLQLLANVQSIRLNFLESASLNYIGYFFNNFLPTSIGGDVVKAHHLSKKTDDKTRPYTSVFMDRAIGLVTMIFMAFAALLITGTSVIDVRVKAVIYAVTAVSALAIAFMIHEPIAKMFAPLLRIVKPAEQGLKKIYRAINMYRHHAILMLKTLAVSVLSQLLYFLSMGVLAAGMGSRISLLDLLLRMPIVSILSLLPSINGLGLREGSTVLLFGPLIGRTNAFALSILLLAMLIVTSVAGGLIYALSPQFRVKLKDMEGEEKI
jgi:uncharacterized protein (TIRG00374 family)